MPDFEIERSDLPKVVTLERCDFPIVEEEVAGYGTVLRLPAELRTIFDEGADGIRICSRDVAQGIPDYGGKTSGNDDGQSYSLPWHQDHLDPTNDRRQYLMLSKKTERARGSSTLIMTPKIAARVLSIEEAYIKDDARRRILAKERHYDSRFLISEEQYNRCLFEPGGYHSVVAEFLGNETNRERELSVRLGLLGYCIRGPMANILMQEVIDRCSGMFVTESWENTHVLILKNRDVFHARHGGGMMLQRNYCT